MDGKDLYLMEFIKTLIEQNTDADGKVNVDAVMNAVKKEFPKHAVPKDVFNQTNSELTDTKKLVEDLKTKAESVEDLQSKIQTFETETAKLKEQQKKDRGAFTLKTALKDAGVTDLDYAVFKLGELETDAEGNPVGLDDKLTTFKADHPALFKQAEDPAAGAKGYTPLDTKLPRGDDPDPEAAAIQEFEKALGMNH